jgi:hypothetical protein
LNRDQVAAVEVRLALGLRHLGAHLLRVRRPLVRETLAQVRPLESGEKGGGCMEKGLFTQNRTYTRPTRHDTHLISELWVSDSFLSDGVSGQVFKREFAPTRQVRAYALVGAYERSWRLRKF